MGDSERPKTPTQTWVGDEWTRQLRKLRKERQDLIETLGALVAHNERVGGEAASGPAFARAKEELERTR